ncbi:uncharacterized protein N7506_011186 [Penicillium brevicompactum]|uniref:uncharacterized protein n=1 Tax=Penicillium brevicompactum TaxID=5074 RepID=UPI002541D83F|nr:uncharacterized protein N7506_011186 [Penicillium brevicompactum]KAJ5322056.1 hypothetical protein N7506_011186 [Penicillium brevicompactum]
MSYDRVLPQPVALRYETAQVPPRSNLDHKIMNDLKPVSVHDYDARLHRMTAPERASKPMGPMLTTKELPLRERSDRSSSSSASSISPVKTKDCALQFCLCQPDPKIPRPRNAFILYRQHYQALVVAHNPGLANPEISKIIGEQWRSLSEDDKSKWKALAEEEKARHQQQYPDYRYQPRRYGRDGSARSAVGGIGHNPSGSSTCNRCGGRLMNAPASPMTPFTPSTGPGYRSSSGFSLASPHPNNMPRSIQGRENDISKSGKVDQHDSRPRQRHWDEPGGRSPDKKRRRRALSKQCDPKYTTSIDPLECSPHRHAIPSSPNDSTPASLHSSKPGPKSKASPLQTAPMTPATPQDTLNTSVEATVMTIPFLNKIKVLAKISPPLLPSFRDSPPARGPVIAIDGQDPALVQTTITYLDSLLKKESKYHVRTFEGPEIKQRKEGQMGDSTVDYLTTISHWHRISDDITSFVKTISRAGSIDHSHSEDDPTNISPRTSLVPKTASMTIHSPAQSSECSEVSAGSVSSHYAVPVALVPRYQLSTADAFACSTPIADSYAPLDHWQWMASLWRACVGPDITVYVRECGKEEVERMGAVEVRLQDARTVVLRKCAGKDLEEKALKRMGFEIEDFLTQ